MYIRQYPLRITPRDLSPLGQNGQSPLSLPTVDVNKMEDLRWLRSPLSQLGQNGQSPLSQQEMCRPTQSVVCLECDGCPNCSPKVAEGRGSFMSALPANCKLHDETQSHFVSPQPPSCAPIPSLTLTLHRRFSSPAQLGIKCQACPEGCLTDGCHDTFGPSASRTIFDLTVDSDSEKKPAAEESKQKSRGEKRSVKKGSGKKRRRKQQKR